jgi:hypothetical protein
LKVGDTAVLGLAISNVHDLFSIPLLIRYNPAVIQIDEIRDGGFLSGGNQEIAIVQHVDQKAGEIIVSAARQPNSSGVGGSGTLLGFAIRAIGRGTTSFEILQTNAQDSQQKQIQLFSRKASVEVQ